MMVYKQNTFSDEVAPILSARKNPDYISVKEYEKALFYRDGKLMDVLGPGRHDLRGDNAVVAIAKGVVSGITLGIANFPQPETEVVMVDTRMKTLAITGQEMITLDKVPVRLNIIAQYRVKDAKKAVNECDNFLNVLYQDLQMSTRNYASGVTLDSLLVNKEEIGKKLMAEVSKKAEKLGVELVSAGLKDVILPGEIKEIMAKVIAAEKEAKSKLILAREEAASARALANAAKIISSDENILVLKRMELLREISKNPANKVYFGDAVESGEGMAPAKKARK